MEHADSDILVPASPEETWEAITDPERLGDWLAEEVTELDLHPGGDHEIAVGEVFDLGGEGGDPLIFFGGAYRPLD